MYQLGNQQFPGEEVEFEPERESFNTYILQDGTKLKLKAVVASIVRLDGVWQPDGSPLYLINASNVVSTDVPDHLRRKQ